MRYPILQSGFVSITEVGMNSPKLEKTSFSETILGQEVDNSLADYFFSVEVEKLIVELKNKPECARTFDFRERVIKAAFRCFAASTISQWVEMQSLRPSLGRLHKEFIADTLLYVYRGKDRSMETLQWSRLLFPESGGSQQLLMSSMFSDKHKQSYAAISGSETAIEVFITNWLSREHGINDMLKSLHVIFGRRAGSGSHQAH